MFDLSTEEARLLLQIALMATGRNRFQSSAKVLAALEEFRPQNHSITVAKMVLMMSAQDFTGAIRFADDEALRLFPDSGMIKSFKGLALIRLARRDEAMQVLAEAAQSTDHVAAQMARDMMS